MLQDPSRQPTGYPSASTGDGGSGNGVGGAGGAATGGRCCTQTGGASASTARSGHYTVAVEQ